MRLSGRKIWQRRKLSGVSQKSLAKATGVSGPAIVSGWEIGARPVPIKYNEAIARALNVSIELLALQENELPIHNNASPQFMKDTIEGKNISMNDLVKFDGQEIPLATVNGEHYVVMKPIVEGMGLDWMTQYEKITSSARYRHMPIPYETSGGQQVAIAIPFKRLNGWLFSINPEKCREDIRRKVEFYQEECFQVLYEHFNAPTASSASSTNEKPDSYLNTETLAKLFGTLQNLADTMLKSSERISKLEEREQHISYASHLSPPLTSHPFNRRAKERQARALEVISSMSKPGMPLVKLYDIKLAYEGKQQVPGCRVKTSSATERVFSGLFQCGFLRIGNVVHKISKEPSASWAGFCYVVSAELA